MPNITHARYYSFIIHLKKVSYIAVDYSFCCKKNTLPDKSIIFKLMLSEYVRERTCEREEYLR